MGSYPPQGTGIGEARVRKIIEDSNKSTDEKILEIKNTLDKYVENDRQFKRKLEAEISRIRESNGDIADSLDQLIDDWNNL